MLSKQIRWLFAALVILTLIISACGGDTEEPAAEEPAAEETAAEEPAAEEPAAGGLQIPDIEEGKFNVAFVMLSTHDDGGWSQAQYDGMDYLQENVDGVHSAYMENVAEGADSEQVFRALSRKGFDLIFGGSFGYMDSMEVVAEEFPDIGYVHISGYKSNMTNFGNMFGEMEVMKYLAGMLAGSRAKMDGETRSGSWQPSPFRKRFRLANAYRIGFAANLPRMQDGRALDQHLARPDHRARGGRFAL